MRMHDDTQIHGHEVIQMMLESETVYTRDSLRVAIQERFGPDARFFTCSGEGMTAGALIDFLADRGKFISVSAGFTIDGAKVCRHDA